MIWLLQPFDNHNMASVKVARKIEIKDYGPVKEIMEIEVSRSETKERITLHQSEYIKEKLQDDNMDNCSFSRKPIEPGFAFQPGKSNPTVREVDLLRRMTYQNAIRSLMYLGQCTIPDIAYAVSLLSRFNHSFNESHYDAEKNVFRYLNSTATLVLTHARTSSRNLFVYCDASYASDIKDYKSITEYIF